MHMRAALTYDLVDDCVLEDMTSTKGFICAVAYERYYEANGHKYE